jgi:hypothetical protein
MLVSEDCTMVAGHARALFLHVNGTFWRDPESGKRVITPPEALSHREAGARSRHAAVAKTQREVAN